MERGIYFDGWFKHNHCYHPSLPLRNIQMLEDLKLYHGTVLIWGGMGGGSISLPYLEQEAYGDVDPRLRFYGFMNDSEFAAECAKAGISLYQTCREFLVECTYSLFERLRGAVETFSGRVVSSEYSSSVLMSILIPEESAGEFERKVTDLSSGNAVCMPGKLRTVEMPHLENT